MVTISISSPSYEVVESSGVVTVCFDKDAETSIPLPFVVQPFEMAPILPDVFQAIGKVLWPKPPYNLIVFA